MIVMLTCIASITGSAASDSRSDSTLTVATRNARHAFAVEIARTPAEMEREGAQPVTLRREDDVANAERRELLRDLGALRRRRGREPLAQPRARRVDA